MNSETVTHGTGAEQTQDRKKKEKRKEKFIIQERGGRHEVSFLAKTSTFDCCLVKESQFPCWYVNYSPGQAQTKKHPTNTTQ